MRIDTQYQTSPMVEASRPRTSGSGFSNTVDAGAGRESSSAGSRGVARATEAHLQSVMDQEAEIGTAMERTLAGRELSQREMLKLQATVYSYSQRVELATRVVDRGAGALRQLLNTQL